MKKKTRFKVIFQNQGKIYEIYACGIQQSSMYGFIEIEDLIFGEHSKVVVDPVEERLISEFSGVKRCYIPAHAVLRIDEVEKEGHGKITDADTSGAKVTAFPIFTQGDKD